MRIVLCSIKTTECVVNAKNKKEQKESLITFPMLWSDECRHFCLQYCFTTDSRLTVIISFFFFLIHLYTDVYMRCCVFLWDPCCKCVEAMCLLVRFKSCQIAQPHRLTCGRVIKISNLILRSHWRDLVGHPSSLEKNRRINIGMWLCSKQ